MVYGILGKGTFGTVYAAREKGTSGNGYAIKAIDKNFQNSKDTIDSYRL